jgi:hypothetical protein
MSKIVRVNKAKLKARQINFQVDGKFDADQKDFAKGLGYIPFVWYGTYQLDSRDVEYFELSIVDNVPSLKLTFRDTLGLTNEKKFPTDDTKISVFLNSRSKNLPSIHLDFKIIDFKIFKAIYNCVGVIDVNPLYIKTFKSYPKSSSFEVLKKISDETGLGFYSNLKSTSDQMTWLNTGKKLIHFIEDVYHRSYISDQSFLLGYIDYYYNITLVDLEKEIKRDIKDDKGVLTIVTGELTDDSSYKETVAPIRLTNDYVSIDSNLYFTDYKILNRSTKISINRGYTTEIRFYDRGEKGNLKFKVEPLTDKSGSKIQLRGQPKDNSFKNENLDYQWGGKLDSDNTHKNWLYSKVQNERNLFDLEKVGLELELPNPNFNLYRFQKVSVGISNQSATFTQNHFNQRLSGEWLISEIKFVFKEKVFRQILILVKRDLEVSTKELKS